MSINLIEMVRGQLGDSVIEQLGGVLGESAENTRSAIDAGVPTILGSIVDKVSSDSNAGGMLSGVLDDLDDGIADDFTSYLQPDKQESLLEKGSGLLNGLLGDNMSSVIDMISKFSGIGSKSSSSLLGMVLPLVLGFISKQRSTGGLDQDGVMNLLSSQKDHISQAMPSGMSDLLGQSGIMAGLTSMLTGGAEKVADAAGDVVDGAADMASDAAGAVGDAVSGAVDATADLAGSAKDAVGDAASSVAEGASDLASGAADVASDAASAAGDTVSGVAEAATDIASGAKDAAADAVGATADAVSDAAGTAKDAAASAASGAADAAGQAASAGGSMIRKILPIAVAVIVLLFLLKQCA